jgi:hypothetical protein
MRHRSSSPHDPGSAIQQDIESRAGIALPDDRSPLLVLPHPGHLGDRTEVSLRQVREQGSLGQGQFTSRPLFGRDPSARGHRSERPSPHRWVDAILLGPGTSLCVPDRLGRNPEPLELGFCGSGNRGSGLDPTRPSRRMLSDVSRRGSCGGTQLLIGASDIEPRVPVRLGQRAQRKLGE